MRDGWTKSNTVNRVDEPVTQKVTQQWFLVVKRDRETFAETDVANFMGK
jgi:hypothetical protein